MQTAKEDGTHVGRSSTPDAATREIERLARETDLSVCKIKARLEADVSRGVVGRVVKEARSEGASSSE